VWSVFADEVVWHDEDGSDDGEEVEEEEEMEGSDEEGDSQAEGEEGSEGSDDEEEDDDEEEEVRGNLSVSIATLSNVVLCYGLLAVLCCHTVCYHSILRVLRIACCALLPHRSFILMLWTVL
jgi:hypothetical protein